MEDAKDVVNMNAEAPLGSNEDAQDPAAQYRGVGVNFKAKLIGIDDVADSRGDKMCQDSILKLKAAVKVAGQHKQKILVNISLEGLKILDLLTGEVQHKHPVNKISFVARDLTDRRAFAYIFSAEDGKHKLFGIKTAKVAETLVLSLRDLFQVVYDLKKKELEGGNATNPAQQNSSNMAAVNNQPSIMGGQQGDVKLGAMLQTMESMDQFNEANMFNDPAASTASPPSNTPASTDLFGSETFGAPAAAAPSATDSLTDDLQSLSMPAEQPPPVPGANMTNDQILNAFNQGGGGGMMGGFPQTAAPAAPMYQQPQQYQMQQAAPRMMMSAAPQQAAPANPFGAAPNNAFGAAPSMFPPAAQQQLPVVPPRTGQMMVQQQPPQQQPVFGGAPLLTPQSPRSEAQQQPAPAAPKDPFGDILGGMGQMTAQPQQKAQGSAGIDNYLLNSKGVVPVNDGQPTAMPRNPNDQQNPSASLFG